MYKSGKPIGFWSSVSLGIGSMVGAGIFALLGEAGAISGSAVYISFSIGGVIALLSGYSLGKLGARYPSAGGIVEYLAQSFGTGLFTGSMSIILYISALVALSLVAKTFGNYAATFLPEGASLLWRHFFSTSIIIVFVLINLKGARDVSLWEKITVAVKFIVLTGLAITGLIYMNPELLSPAKYPPVSNIFFSLSITFFAYEGFRVITNAAEDMPDPAKTLPRAMIVSIVLVMALYIAVSFAVFGNLSTSEVIKAKEYALAEAALPIFGHIGFTVIAVTAMISTASSINANLYAVTNVTYQMAKDGELPAEFGKPIAHSREGLVISAFIIIILSLLFNLSEVAALGSISILFVHTVTHVGHLKKIKETGASFVAVLTAVIISFIAMSLAIFYVSKTSDNIIQMLIGFLIIAAIIESVLQKVVKRKIKQRIY